MRTSSFHNIVQQKVPLCTTPYKQKQGTEQRQAGGNRMGRGVMKTPAGTGINVTDPAFSTSMAEEGGGDSVVLEG